MLHYSYYQKFYILLLMNSFKQPFLKIYLPALLTAVASFFISCDKNSPADENTRSFYMGTTPWPADFTAAEVDTAYQFINEHCDIISHHFDDGIPYEEVYTGQPFPVAMQQDIQTRLTKTNPGKKVFLSVAALNITRQEKPEYYNQSAVSTGIKDAWKLKPVNDPAVITAYLEYISRLIDALNPVMVNFAVESNMSLFPSASFLQYKEFIAQVYPALKSKYPAIPFFVSFMVDETNTGFEYARQLLPYTDYIGLSAYPYTGVTSSANGNTDPSRFPAGYFDRYIRMADKPLAFAETGYIAENLLVPSYNLNKQGLETWQRDYFELICRICNENRAKLLIWFCSKDYDAGNIRLQSLGLYQDLFALWQDIGLKDPAGRSRPVMQSWLGWMQKKKTD